MSESVIKKNDRRSFLRGSALFAAALGMSVVPAFAQEKPRAAAKARAKARAQARTTARRGRGKAGRSAR